MYYCYLFTEHVVYFLEKQGLLYDYSARYNLNISNGSASRAFLGLIDELELRAIDAISDRLESLMSDYFDDKIELSSTVYKYLEKVCRKRVIECRERYKG